MDDKLLRYTLRVDRVYFQKFRYIAGMEGRSANKELEQYIKKRVTAFEEENGRIETEPPVYRSSKENRAEDRDAGRGGGVTEPEG